MNKKTFQDNVHLLLFIPNAFSSNQTTNLKRTKTLPQCRSQKKIVCILTSDRYVITQIGAVHAGSANCFNESPNSKTSIGTVLVNFFKWLKTVNNGDPVVLVAHNAKRFDMQVLETVTQQGPDFKVLLQHHRKSIPAGVVAGYCDSLIAFRKNFPLLEEYSMGSLAKHFEVPRRSHDALEDSKLLKKLVQTALQGKQMKYFSKTVSLKIPVDNQDGVVDKLL
jgi:hypothetical protein